MPDERPGIAASTSAAGNGDALGRAHAEAHPAVAPGGAARAERGGMGRGLRRRRRRDAPAPLPPGVTEHTADVDGMPVFWRAAQARDDAAATPLYLHGVPSNSDEWLPFMARSGGIAVDLPGFGRSGKPAALAYTIAEYAEFIARFLDAVGKERVALVMHDWGALGLAFAQARPERIERLVLIDAVPFLPGYSWHRVARIWRTPVLGELAMGSTTPRVLSALSRAGNATPGPLPRTWQRSVLDHFDEGTRRAILRLYRGAPSDVLARAGAQLDELRVPALVVWGARDPYIPARFAHEYARALGDGDAEVAVIDDAGHWPWLDKPGLIERVTDFLARA